MELVRQGGSICRNIDSMWNFILVLAKIQVLNLPFEFPGYDQLILNEAYSSQCRCKHLGISRPLNRFAWRVRQMLNRHRASAAHARHAYNAEFDVACIASFVLGLAAILSSTGRVVGLPNYNGFCGARSASKRNIER